MSPDDEMAAIGAKPFSATPPPSNPDAEMAAIGAKPVSAAKPDDTTYTDYGRAAEDGLTMGFGKNINAAARYAVGNKTAAGGGSYAELLQEEKDRINRLHELHPYVATGLELAGGLALPGGIVAKGAKEAATLGKATLDSAKVGAGFGAVSGAGHTESDKDTLAGQAYDRLGGALEGGAAGAAVGSILPAASAAVAGTARRIGELIAPTSARVTGGTNAVADLAVQRAAERSGMSVDEMQAAFDANPQMMAADLHPAFKHLAGSVTRNSPEAEDIAKRTLFARQTGNSIDGDAASITDGQINGMPARPDFQARLKKDDPAGQIERTADQLRTAWGLKTAAPNAHKANDAIVAQTEKEAKKAFDAVREAGDGYDIRGTIQPIIDEWQQKSHVMPYDIGNQVRIGIRHFTTQNVETSERNTVSGIDNFMKSKEFLDNKIGKYFGPGESRNTSIGKPLSDFRSEMVAAIDGIKDNDLGTLYKKARDQFSSNQDITRALEAGQNAIKNGSDIATDTYKNMSTSGEKRMFRLGLYSDLMRRPAGRTEDATKLFNKPDVRELIANITSKPDRAELAGFIGQERNMSNTANEILGNSKTAGRQAADANYTADTAADWLDTLHKATPTYMKYAALRGVGDMVSKLFSYKTEVATEIAQRLFTANDQDRMRVLQTLRTQCTPQQYSQFVQSLGDITSKIRQVATMGGEQMAGGAAASPQRNN